MCVCEQLVGKLVGEFRCVSRAALSQYMHVGLKGDMCTRMCMKTTAIVVSSPGSEGR